MAEPLRIFLAEDNYPDVLYLKQLLLRAGLNHTLHVCDDGEQALDYLIEAGSSSKKLPDIVLLDIKLPKYSGLEILEKIRSVPRLVDLPVVIVTGSDDPGDMTRTNRLGASYVKKPADMEKMCQILSVLEHACFSISGSFKIPKENGQEQSASSDCRSQSLASSAMSSSQSPLRSSLESQSHKSDGHNLLLIEDNPHDVRLTTELLHRFQETASFNVQAVESIAHAKAILHEKEFDVIALDLGLPDSLGLDGFEEIHRTAPDVPVVIVTGFGEQALGKTAIGLGAQDYVVKNTDNYGEVLTRSLNYAIHRKGAEVLAKSTLIREHRILQEALAKVPILVIRIDRQFSIIDTNSTTETEFAQSREDLVGQNILSLLPDIDRQDIQDLLAKGIPFHRSSYAITKTPNKSHQETFWDLLAWPVQSPDQIVREAIVLAIDVTEKVKASQQRDEFVQTLAHDIKNPMLGEQWVLNGLLQHHGPDIKPTAVAYGIQEVFRSNQSLVRMLTNLLEAYKFESNLYSPFVTPLEIQDVLSECLVEMATIFKIGNINVITKIEPEISSFNGDRIAFQRLVTNILHNAVKFSPNEGTIVIVARREQDKLILSVSDDGPGISKEEQQSLFKRFATSEQGKRGMHGSGLGLYICRRIVEAHQGEIVCTSEPDQGTTFTVTLPLTLDLSPICHFAG